MINYEAVLTLMQHSADLAPPGINNGMRSSSYAPV
jgi:hypothetical protein